MNFKKLLICFVSLTAGSVAAYVIACGWFVDPDAGYTSYFRRDIPEKNNYYYSYFNFYDDVSDKESDKAQNIAEWKKHLGGKVAEADIESLLYGISLDELTEIYRKANARHRNKIAGSQAENGMMQRIVRLRDMNTLNYLLYAKACEQQAGKRTESWDYSSAFDTSAQDSLLHRGLQLYAAPQPEFTKLRYAFQVVRMAYYCGRKEDCVRYYREMIEPAEKSKASAKLWALSFCAGAEESSIEAAYKFSKVFDRCPRYSREAMMSYRRLTEPADTAFIVALCENDYEKAVVHSMTGFTCFYPTLEPLKHVHRLCPAVPYIETLLIREINKIEDGLSAAYFHESASFRPDDAIRHARELQDLTIRYAGLREVQRPALWYTAAAYLTYLLGEYDRASLLADIAEKENPEPKVAEQLSAVRLLIETDRGPLDEAAEARILPSLRWLLGKLQADSTDAGRAFFDRTVAHYFAEKLPGIYSVEGQFVKAALCIGIAERYSAFARRNIYDLSAFEMLDKHASIPQLEDMLYRISVARGKLNAYETFLYEHNRFDDRTVIELIGTKYMRTLRFEEAAVCFRQLSGNSDLAFYEYDPFAEPPVAEARNNQKSGKPFSCSKLTFAHEMAALQNRIRTASKPSPDDLYRYASGLYQMSYFGNSWQMLSYSRTVNDAWDRVWEKLDRDKELYHYYNLETAKNFFLQASQHSRDKEFRARCLFMASQCYQMNAASVYTSENGRNVLGVYFRNNPYFQELNKKYRRTDFYKDVVTRCSYLSDFEKMKK